MKLSTSYKDILLIAGIVVAIIISITTWYSRSTAQTSQITPLSTPKLNTSSISKKLGQAVLNIAKQHR